MSKVKLNKKSVKQQGGAMIPGQPAMSNQQPMHQMPDGTMMPGATHGDSGQQQVDPMIKQITELISTSINEGKEIVDVIIELSQQEVDQQVIAQALMMGGMEQQDVVTLFEQVQVKMQPPGPASPNEVNNNPELLARNQYLEEQDSNQNSMNPMAKSGIEIKPENKGKFTAWAKARGMGVQEAASKVMANKDKYSPSVVKMANFAKNAAGWKKEEGGEFKPHWMVKGDDAIEAMSHDQHLALGEKGYTHIMMQGGGVEGVRQREGSYNPPNREYTLDPRFRDYGGEPRSFMEWYGQAAEGDEIENSFVNQTDQYVGGTKTPGFDQSYNLQDFIGGLNPQGNPVLKGLGLLNNIKTELFSNEVGANGLTKGALTGIKDKRNFSNAARPLYFDKKITYDNSDRNMFMVNNYKNSQIIEDEATQSAINEDYNNSIANASGINPELLSSQEYFNSIGIEMNDALGSEFNDKLYQRYLDSYNKTYPQKKYGGSLYKAQEGVDFPIFDEEGNEIENPTANEFLNEVEGPTTEIENPFSGLLNFIGDSPGARAATSLSKVGVDLAGFRNDIFDMQKFEEAKENREKMFMADNYANIKVDGVGNKGFWDINDGGLMSNKDRVTGIDEAAFNMFGTPQYSQEGGGVNNSGFKALPPHVQHNILSNMASGGEAAYLANRDRVIKREMAKAQEGGETVNLSQDMIAELIAAGADIEIL